MGAISDMSDKTIIGRGRGRGQGRAEQSRGTTSEAASYAARTVIAMWPVVVSVSVSVSCVQLA